MTVKILTSSRRKSVVGKTKQLLLLLSIFCLFMGSFPTFSLDVGRWTWTRQFFGWLNGKHLVEALDQRMPIFLAIQQNKDQKFKDEKLLNVTILRYLHFLKEFLMV